MKVLIFGTGKTYRRFQHVFQDMEIVGFADNNPEVWGALVDGVSVIPPEKIPEKDFDFIFLASIYYEDIRRQLINMGIAPERIIDKEHRGFLEQVSQTEQYLFPVNEVIRTNHKRILMFSHILNLSGAPIVLSRLANVLKGMGYEITIVAEKNSALNHGVLLYQLLQEHISVILAADYNMLDVEKLAEEYDLYWVNTVLLGNIVKKLLPTRKNVFWWLHETEDIYNEYRGKLEFPIGSNLYVLSVGWMAKQSFEKYSQHKVFGNLMYGMPDIAEGPCIAKTNGQLTFCLIGEYSERKGQDILYQVIKKNADCWRDIAEFYFIGLFPEIKKREYETIDMIHVLGELSPQAVSEFYRQIDVLVSPSLSDPMPVVVTEAMQHKKVCLVTDRVGQSRYISPMKDGLVCSAGDEKDLEKKLCWLINNKEKLEEMGRESFEIYRKHFSMESFENNITELIELSTLR